MGKYFVDDKFVSDYRALKRKANSVQGPGVNAPGVATIYAPQRRRTVFQSPGQNIPVYIPSVTAGATSGVYPGRILTGGSQSTDTVIDDWTVATTDNCWVVNLTEYNPDTVGVLGVSGGSYHPNGRRIGTNAEDGLPIIGIDFPVMVRFGKLKVLWEAGATTVLLQPCKGWNDSTLLGADDVSCKIFAPASGQAAPLLAAVNQILAFRYTDAASSPALGYLIDPPVADGAFLVTLSQTGGSNGTKTTAASWTYSATIKPDASTDVTLGTGLSPVKPRPYGTAVAATAGLGCYANNGTTFTLIEAFEKYGTGGCA